MRGRKPSTIVAGTSPVTAVPSPPSYFPKDANAIEYTDANARFGKGEGVFMFNGDWQNGGYDKDQPGNVGFFVFPPAEAGGNLAAMSAPLTFGIA